MTFASLRLPDSILKGVEAAGYRQPTPIQRDAVPVILEGQDLIAAAQTGSGKTAAFVLPILARLLRGHHSLRCLVLVPTRELAAQIEESARTYARFTTLRVGAVFGGVPIPPQERMLRQQGVDLLVATPGRLLDLHGRQSLALEDVKVLVLDEADRMVDMGFAPDLRRILKLLPRERQTLMFSATMPRDLNVVAKEALHHPRRVELAPPSQSIPSITQRVYPVSNHRKIDLLDHILSGVRQRLRAIVFARTRRSADRLASRLKSRGHAVVVLHGDREQRQRERALLDFKRGRAGVLVATDIASRGIDVDHVTHVINYEAPRAPEDYVHRIGRTGRMEATGEAITLMSPEEREQVADIERFQSRAIERVTMKDFDYGGHPEPPRAASARAASSRTDSGRAGHPARDRRDGRHTATRSTPSKPHGSPQPAGPKHGVRHEPPASTNPAHGRRRRINPSDRRSRKRF